VCAHNGRGRTIVFLLYCEWRFGARAGRELRRVIGDDGGVGGEAVALGAVALDEFLAVAIAQGALEVLAELAVALAVLDVVDELDGLRKAIGEHKKNRGRTVTIIGPPPENSWRGRRISQSVDNY